VALSLGRPVSGTCFKASGSKFNATVDAEGIARLKQVLDKYEEILKLLQ
jgi:hypothetical protein